VTEDAKTSGKVDGISINFMHGILIFELKPLLKEFSFAEEECAN